MASKAKKNEPKKNEGSERNEYIPSFIAKKPFYVDGDEDDYLEHQRLQSQQKDPVATAKWYDRGKTSTAATKYRKGACENCGSLTHKAKDCLERKRKLGAKWTGKNIAADEVVEDIKLGWDAKRDRWNGYDVKQFEEVIEDFQNRDDSKYEETEVQSTSRNLRLREDTASYLRNLDADTYDPKTRTAEEGFERASGDAADFERAQIYAWETQERGDKDKLHLQANPTAGEVARKRKAEEELTAKEAKKKSLLEAYGDQKVGKPLALANEAYTEYDDRGRIKGEKREKSMYAEDVFNNNHTSVWGSWWKDFKWGYSCCHSTIKNSFCVGEEGMKAAEESEAMRLAPIHAQPTSTAPPLSTESRKRVAELNGVSEAELEQYRKDRMLRNDPMAAHLGQDVIK